MARNNHTRRIPNEKRYWQKVVKRGPNQCWPWTGSAMNTGGYGQFYLHDDTKTNGLRTYAAHRYAYELAYGPIPQGRSILHTCGNIICQNPRHLRLGKERGYQSKITHCSHGHEYTPDNTLVHPKTGAKICKACNRQRQRDYRERNSVATVRPALARRPVFLG